MTTTNTQTIGYQQVESLMKIRNIKFTQMITNMYNGICSDGFESFEQGHFDTNGNLLATNISNLYFL